MEITSTTNNLIKQIAKLKLKKYRDEFNEFLIEGFKAIEGAKNSDIIFKHVFVLSKSINKYEFLKTELTIVSEDVMKKLSSTDTPPDAIAIGEQKRYNIDILKTCKNVALLENIKDTGNLGTIIRSAAAFSIDAIILYGETVDLYNPKVVRSTVGNMWKVPVIQINNIEILKKYFNDYSRIATLPKNEATIYLKDFSPQNKSLIMLGAEAEGLSSELINFSNEKVTIEMSNSVESLNLSVSASIIFYEFMIKKSS